MCNKLHNEEFINISETGIGYKIFILRPKFDGDKIYDKETCDNTPLTSLCGGKYHGDPEECWTIWVEEALYEGDGFCFFRSLEDAIRVARMFSTNTGSIIVVCKIVYRKGLGEFNEDGITGYNERSSLAKEFRVITRVAYLHAIGYMNIPGNERPRKGDWSGNEYLYEKRS